MTIDDVPTTKCHSHHCINQDNEQLQTCHDNLEFKSFTFKHNTHRFNNLNYNFRDLVQRRSGLIISHLNTLLLKFGVVFQFCPNANMQYTLCASVLFEKVKI